MANKRIELEQCKYYVNLQEEYPNRKTVRKGVRIALITAMLLVFAFFVLGMISGDLASNPANVLEQPPEKVPEMPTNGEPTPEMLEQMNIDTPVDQQMPMEMPTDQQIPMQLPEGVPPIPMEEEGSPPGGSSRSVLEAPVICDVAPGTAAGEGALLAQAEPGEALPDTPAEIPPDTGQEITIPAPDSSVPGQSAPTPADGEQVEDEGPDKQTTGIGNLANLVDIAGGRGFQIYLLVLVIGLLVVLYLAERRVRLEGKHK